MNHWHFIAPPNETVEKTLGIVRCGRCGRPLTDPESVAKGIGPVCEAHGVAKGFPGHRGRPGKVGGSLPRKAGKGAGKGKWTDEERAAFHKGYSIAVSPDNPELFVVVFPEGDMTTATNLATARKWLRDALEIERE